MTSDEPAGRPRLGHPLIGLAVVVVGLAVVVLGADTVRPARPVAAGAGSGRVPVTTAALTCPDPAPFGAGTADIALGSFPLSSDAPDGASGAATAGSLDPDAPARLTVRDRGRIGALAIDGPGETVVVRGAGGLAAGLTAGVTAATDDGDLAGLAAAACTAPTTEAWFVGLGTELGHRPRLVLANPEPAPAEVDVELFGPDGPLAAPELSDLVVPARSSASYELDVSAPDLDGLAVHVRARTGRVAATVRDEQVDGILAKGIDWIPGTGSAASRVIVPGVAGGPGTRRLQLLAPGDLDAQVSLRLLTADGPVVPLDRGVLDLLAGVVTEVALHDLTGEQAVAVELVADQPIVAGLRVDVGPADGAQDMAYAIPTMPLSGPAMVPHVPTGDGYTAELLLSADPDATEDSTVVVSYVSAASGEVTGSADVTVPPGSTVAVAVAPEAGSGRTAVVVTADTGSVVGVLVVQRLIEERPQIALLALSSPELTVEARRVRLDLSTGL